ncbi:ammonia-dependent NAD(+) synthetase [Marinobacter lacisalsi]|uniref:NH(3)-dependent NAD(+) synthetase n=1 Tax=Marinobacter lacisalsi TaxID=475979 RepID=A0ABV8QGB8_9GAMM
MNDNSTLAADDMLREWAVQPTEGRDWDAEITSRVRFLQQTLISAGRNRLVLGISGGVDSLVAGKLCQLAIDGLKTRDPGAAFIAVRLPYGVQADEGDAQASIAFIGPDRTDLVDIEPAVNAIHTAVMGAASSNHDLPDEARLDFERGNVKARVRMTVQYEIAALNNGLVVGTDHNAEGITGFYTKWGDGACDLLPLRGLNKRQVRLLGKALGAGPELHEKPATADLEDLRPLRSDEEALGVTYDVIDDFLEGKAIADADLRRIKAQYLKTQHKRSDPPAAMGPFTGQDSQTR